MFLKIGTILTIVLILFDFTSTIIKADDDEESKIFDVVRKNWLNQNQTHWPDYDGGELFYIFYHENVEQKLSFKKDIINWSELNPNGTILSFRYWANNDLGRLRSKPDTAKAKDLLLDQGNQWTNAKIGELTQKEWNNLTVISGGDEYTLALKDVLFSYTDSNHKQVTINCSESNGCSNIFDRPLAQSKQYGSSPNHFVPYQRNNPQAHLNQPPQTYLQVNRPQTKNANDFCIKFLYKASGPLFVSADISIAHPLTIEFPPTTEPDLKSVCASALTPSLDESLRALYFWFANDKTINLLDSNYVELYKNNQPQANNILSEGIFLHDQKENPFFDGYYSSYDSTISFNLFYDLQKEKKQLKSQLIQKVEYRSKWIKIPTKRSNQFQIVFKVFKLFQNETNELPAFAQLTMIVSAPDRAKLFEKRLEPFLEVDIFNIKFDSSVHLPPIQHVQILFSFQIDFSKVKEEKEFRFELRHFSANDPCVDEHGTENECSNRGKCVRNYEQFEGICHCEAGYSAKDQCKSIDYCTERVRIFDGYYAPALEICKNQGLNCVSNAEKQIFECDCGNLRWNSVAWSCFPKELSKCPENQIHEQIDGKLQCVCRYGMRLDSQTNKCVSNSCSEENNRKCVQKGAICQVQSSGSKCSCEPGKVAFLVNTDRPDEWTCMDKCSVVEHFLDDQKDQKLEALRCQQFSKCDSLQVEFDNYYNIEEKVVFKKSNLTLHYGPSATGICKCNIGFEKYSRYQCEPSSAPIWLLSGLQFEIFLNLTEQIEKQETVEQMVSNLFETIFTEKTRTRESVNPNLFSKCEHKSSFGVSCDVFLSTLKSAEEITEKLLYNCIPITGSTGKQCVLFTSHILHDIYYIYQNKSFTGEIILQADSVTPPKLFSNFCDNKELCPTNFDNSICKSTTSTGNGTDFFDCLCDRELFDVSATTLLGESSTKLKGEKCKLKNLCQTKFAQFGCKDPTAQCHSVVEYENGTYVPMSFCTCPKTGHVTHDREYICPK